MKIYLLFTCMLTASTVFCQDTSSSLFKMGDRIDVKIDNQHMPYHPHTVAKGHTMYSLARAYNITLEHLYTYNEMEIGQSLALGTTLRVPIPQEMLYVGRSLKRKKEGHYIPVYYKTKPKDNLYRLSRQYFPQPMEDLMERNSMITQDLPLGKDILVGWFALDKEPQPTQHQDNESLTTVQVSPEYADTSVASPLYLTDSLAVAIEDSTLAVSYPEGFNVSLLGSISYHEDMRCIKKTDVATWDKSLHDNGSVFALHSSAALDSYIYVYNTNTHRSLRIKVIGRIPYGTYTNNINLVISPRAAIQLGGLDRRFKVEVEYIKE